MGRRAEVAAGDLGPASNVPELARGFEVNGRRGRGYRRREEEKEKEGEEWKEKALLGCLGPTPKRGLRECQDLGNLYYLYVRPCNVCNEGMGRSDGL